MVELIGVGGSPAGRLALVLRASLTALFSSPVVVLLPGHGRPAFEHPAYRRLVANAVAWVGSDDARRWAVQRGAAGFDDSAFAEP